MKINNTLHGNLPLPVYWRLHRNQIAEIRRWGTIERTSYPGKQPKSKKERRDAYMRQCDRNMEVLATFLPNLPMCDLSAFDLLTAVMKSKTANGRTYAESTLKSRLSLLRDIYDFAEDRGDATNDLRFVADKTLAYYLEGLELPADERKKHFRKLAQEHKNKVRSLTPQQQARLVRTCIENIEEDGRYLALAIMLYMGLRPSECRGLNWSDLIPFEDRPDRRMLVVCKQRDDQNNLIDRLKTTASYRKLGVHFELQNLIHRRREFVLRCGVSEEEIGALPICCIGNDFAWGCTGSQLSVLASKILKDIVRVAETTMETCMLDMFALEDEAKDLKVSTYLLRHDCWTWLQASTELSANDKRYFFGHTMFDGMVDRRPLYNMEDRLWDMLVKLDHMIKFLPLHEIRLHGMLNDESDISVANVGVYTLHIPAEALRTGGEVEIILDANEAEDPISVKFLTPTKLIFCEKPLKVDATVNVRMKEEGERKTLNTDYANWYMRRGTRKEREVLDQPNKESGR